MLESIRSTEEFGDALGEEPITLGLWVGAGTSPNALDKDSERSPGARQLYERMLEEEDPQNLFQLTSCPRCGTLIVPRKKSPKAHYGVEVSLRAILSESVEREWSAHNVAADVKLKRSARSDAYGVVIPTKDEIRTIISKAPSSHRAMFVTAIFTGMRISEIRGLTWAGVDFERRLIRVYQRADEFCQIGAPKSRAGVREIPMAPTVLETLSKWKVQVPDSDLGLVFPNSVGKVQNYANIYNRVFKAGIKTNRGGDWSASTVGRALKRLYGIRTYVGPNGGKVRLSAFGTFTSIHHPKKAATRSEETLRKVYMSEAISKSPSGAGVNVSILAKCRSSTLAARSPWPRCQSDFVFLEQGFTFLS